MLEEEDFGPHVGIQSLYEATWVEFHKNCLASSSEASDSTGQRLYAGAHVAIRFLARHIYLLKDQSIVELGCGIGAYGLLTFKQSEGQSLLLTDGREETLELTRSNIAHVLRASVPRPVNTMMLEWGNSAHIACAQDAHNSGQPFNVVLGCELMYYRTNVQQLLSTVLDLTHTKGLFIHAHLFRRPGQEQELQSMLQSRGWSTLEAPAQAFLSAHELAQHGEWYRVRTLISGPIDMIALLLQRHSGWKAFQVLQEEEEQGGEGALLPGLFC